MTAGGGAPATAVPEHASAHTGPRRVVLTGSESTGKTTLAIQLAARFGGILVPEFARAYAAGIGRPLTFEDHAPIARGQVAAEDALIPRGWKTTDAGLVVQDTDLLSTAIYCGHYYGHCPAWLSEAARARRPDLYLLMETDVRWVPDGVRDRGERREEVQQLFREAVARSGAAFLPVTGSWDERLRVASAAVSSLAPSAPSSQLPAPPLAPAPGARSRRRKDPPRG